MIADPFGGLVLRDLVPLGAVITPALPEETVEAALRRAVRDSGGTPAFLAIENEGRPPMLMRLRRLDDGRLHLDRPGDWRSTDAPIAKESTLADAIRAMDEAHGYGGM